MSDYESAQRKHNVIVGLFVVIAIVALVWLIFKFGDFPAAVSKMRSFQVFVQFPSAPGVQKDTPVRFCGYPIGRVTEVMAPQIRRDLNSGLEYYQAVIVLSIQKKYRNIPSNIVVKLMTRGLGSSYIELALDPTLPLKPQDPNRPETKYLVPEMWLQGSTGMTSEFFPEESQKKLDALVNNLCTLIDNANDVLGDRANKENIKSTLANLSEASAQTKKSLDELQKFFVAGTDTSEQLSKTVAELRLILHKINTGEGTAARLINDGRLYESLLENTHQMQALLQQLEEFMAKSRNQGLPIKLK